MIRTITRRAADSMAQRYQYDASYLNAVAASSSGAAIRLGLLPLFSQYQGNISAALWAGAAVGSTLDGDCGPCAQLTIDMALERGVPAPLLNAALQGHWDEAGEVGLGMRFATAAITDSPDLPELQAQVKQAYGDAGLATLSIVSATARAWPVIKRGLGYGKVCQSVYVDDQKVDLALDTHPTAAL